MVNKTKHGATREAAWAIRGVNPETRTAAKVAARRQGVTVGEFVSRAVRDAAKSANQLPSTDTQDQVMAKILELVEKQNERIEQLEKPKGFLGRLFGG